MVTTLSGNLSHIDEGIDETFEFATGRPLRPKGHPFWLLLSAVGLWLVIVLAGLSLMQRHSFVAGTAGASPASWPAACGVAQDIGHPTLVMFVHPHCPCSRASIGELEQIMARCQGQVTAHVWFARPAGTSEDWVKTDTWRSAQAIPGVTVHCDDDEFAARLFKAETSGQTALYNRDGSLMFQGGITLSRGHAGDNPGRSAIESLLARNLSSPAKTPVFGCTLADAATQKPEDAWNR